MAITTAAAATQKGGVCPIRIAVIAITTKMRSSLMGSQRQAPPPRSPWAAYAIAPDIILLLLLLSLITIAATTATATIMSSSSSSSSLFGGAWATTGRYMALVCGEDRQWQVRGGTQWGVRGAEKGFSHSTYTFRV